MILEVCIDSVESALAAQEGGAARVELCADLEHGGTTPSAGMIRSVREHISIALYAMIRPRPGDFCYSEYEFEVMKSDIEKAKGLGVDGFVFGILTSEGEIDIGRTRSLIDLARPLSVTFHRAFDECPNLHRALDDLKGLGVERILTSGGKGDLSENGYLLADLVRRSYGSVRIMVGGGIDFENVSEIATKSKANEFHSLSAVTKDLPANAATSNRFSSPRKVVDASKVRALVQLLRDLSPDSQR